MLQAFLEDRGVEQCTTLRRVICSGEALGVNLQERFFERLGGVELNNLYGPTEAAIDVTYWRCEPNDGRSSVPIGRPIANTQLYILDREMEVVPVGVKGELYVGGTGVGRGYLYDPQRTAESFVPNPFSGVAGERLYRTGDLCRYLQDGEIEFLGRIDDQVKVRGFRIELGEIEAALSSHSGVAEAVVVVREDNEGDKRLVAYVVPSPEQEFLQDDLREYLKTQLPDYMTPQVFVMLDALPLTPNGKLDRHSLPTPDYSNQARAKGYQAPRNDLEKIVAEIWCEVLGEQQIGVEDNFFSVGGHSLLATQVVSRVRQRFEIELPLRVMFEAPTIAELSIAIKRVLEQQTRAQAPALTRTNRRERQLNQLLERVQSLSEAEARQTLQSKKESKQVEAQ